MTPHPALYATFPPGGEGFRGRTIRRVHRIKGVNSVAVAAEYKLKTATVRILDDEIRDVPEAEMAQRIRETQRTAWRIWYEQHRRERKGGDPSSAPDGAPSPQGEGLEGGQ